MARGLLFYRATTFGGDNMDGKFFTASEAATFAKADEGHLANLRSQKRGCRFFKLGRKVLYDKQDFENWVRSSPVLTIDSLKAER
jgi:hypothetical protein